MTEPQPIPGAKPESNMGDDAQGGSTHASSMDDGYLQGPPTPYLSSTPGSPYLLSRNSSYFGSHSAHDDFGDTPPEKLTFFDIFENLSLPSRIEKWQATLQAQKEKVKRQQEKLRTAPKAAKDRAMAELKRRVPTSDEQLAKYRYRMKKSVDDLNKRWAQTVTISTKEKISFLSAVFNILISGYLIGACPQYFYYWFTAQILYFMPIRYITYHRKGYHYFLADLCYFVNALALLSIWVFPRSKRLFIATWCLAFGNNAVAIVMWRNSLVFHSLDKVTSLFIHVMPPVMLHCIAHLTPREILYERFPAVYTIKFSQPGTPEHYSLPAMLLWATLPYAIWQLSYHFFITVRRAEKIAAGRPTSFTWLRKSYAKTRIGKIVISLPEVLQEPAFMLIQYSYACLTILPCPLWFWYRWASAGFLLLVFGWSVWNGANYYMDVFGTRFQKELEQMKRDVAKWQNSPGVSGDNGTESPAADTVDGERGEKQKGMSGEAHESSGVKGGTDEEEASQGISEGKRNSVDNIPLLDGEKTQQNATHNAKSTGANIMRDADSSSITERR